MKTFKSISISIFSLSLLLTISCTKTNLNEELAITSCTPNCLWNCETSNLKIVWQHPVEEDTSQAHVKEIIYDGTNLYYNGWFESVYAREKQYGDLIWEWNDYHPNSRGNGSDDLANATATLFVNAKDETHAVDKISGQNQWVYSTEEDGGRGLSRISANDQNVFHIHIPECEIHSTQGHLVTASTYQSKTNLPQWDTLYSFIADEERFVAVETPEVWRSSNDEVILLISVHHWGDDNSKNHTDLVAYNFTKKDIQFIIQDIVPGAVGKPIISIHGEKAALLYSSGIACVDLVKGERKWLKSESGNFIFNRSLYLNDEMIIVERNRVLHSFSINYGNFIWKNANTDLIGAKFFGEYEGKLIGINGNFLMLDMTNGEIIMNEVSPNNAKYSTENYFNEGVVVDTENGLVYTSDNRFIQCIDVK